MNPQQTTTYQCTATGSVGPPATASVTVQVTPATTTPPPTIIVGGLSGLTCSAPTAPGNVHATYVCQTVVRQVQINLSQSTSPAGNTPLTYLTASQNSAAAVLGATSAEPIVQLGEQFGDYFFTVVVTDSKGNQATATVDIELAVTRVP